MENITRSLNRDTLKFPDVNEKKKRNLKPLIIGLIVIFVIISLGALGLLYKGYRYDMSIQNIFNESLYSTKSDVIKTVEIVKDLPKKVTDILIKNNVKISYIPWEPIDGYVGYFQSEDRLIQVQYLNPESTNALTKYTNEITTLHEIGHAFDCDFSLNLIGYTYSGDMQFQKIYEKEADKLLNVDVFPGSKESYLSYYKKSRWEYFAESFALYFTNDETNQILLKNAPRTYNFIKKITEPNDGITFSKYIKEKLVGDKL